jgi:hypothetical protein
MDAHSAYNDFESILLYVNEDAKNVRTQKKIQKTFHSSLTLLRIYQKLVFYSSIGSDYGTQ